MAKIVPLVTTLLLTMLYTFSLYVLNLLAANIINVSRKFEALTPRGHWGCKVNGLRGIGVQKIGWIIACNGPHTDHSWSLYTMYNPYEN